MVLATVPVYRLSVQDVHRMVAAGVLDEDERIELVDGMLVEMTPIGAEHDGALAWLTRHFAGAGAGAGRRASRAPSSSRAATCCRI